MRVLFYDIHMANLTLYTPRPNVLPEVRHLPPRFSGSFFSHLKFCIQPRTDRDASAHVQRATQIE